jgi:transposase-like protein
MRRRFTDDERIRLLREYLSLPRGQRKNWVAQNGVEASLLSRWHWQYYGMSISDRDPGDSLDPSVVQRPRRERKEPRKTRSVSQASYEELKRDNRVLKGLVSIANQRGFLERFLAVQPDDDDSDRSDTDNES